jgi:hypothetical protein
MKKILVSCLVVIASLIITRAHAQEKDPNQLVQKLWTAVKNSDEQAYLKLFPNYEQMRALFKSIYEQVKDSAIKASIEKEFIAMTEEQFKEKILPSFTEEFSRFLVNARQRGIDLNALHFVNMEYDTINRRELGFNYHTLKGTIYLKNDTADYELSFSESIWSEADQGWYGAMLGRIKKKGEKEEIGTVMPTEEIMMDSVSKMEVIEVPPPPPPPPQAKTIQKKSTTTKSSPARKPKTKS